MSLKATFQKILNSTDGGMICPAHDDQQPSFSASMTKDESKILIKCHAGCSFDSILSALNLNASDLFEKSKNNPKSERREVARYRYLDEDNEHLFDVVRFEPKDFRQQAADGTWNTQNFKKVPFDLPLLKASIQSEKTLLMLEGEKDCLKAEEMGYPATTLPGGAGKWREEYLQYFNDADLVLIPDLDQSGIKGMTRIGEALYGTAKRLRWIKLPGLGDVKTKHGKDFFDWCNLDNSTPEKLKEIIATSPDWIPPKQIKSKKTFFYEGGQFIVSDDAVIYYPQPKVDKEGNEEPPVPCWICSKLEIESATRDSESEAWGRFLVWKDQDDVEHRWSAPVELLEGDGIDLRRYLAHKGLKISTNRKAKESLLAYIKFWPTEERSRCVNRLGWHGSYYITHNKTIGAIDNEKIVFQSDSILRPSSACAGTIEDWKRTIAAWASGNSRVLFSISCAAAGPLLELAGAEGGGFHLRGPSSCGKTTLLHAAASLYGPPADVVRSWRSTSNALEGIAALHNDCTLMLDELSQMASGDAAEASYMLANGAGKSRANQRGIARRALTWRLLFLSSGEESLSQLMSQKNKKTNPGAELRMLDIPAEANRNLGVFEQLNSHESGAALALAFKDNCRLYYGNAGEKWLNKVVENRKAIAEQLPKLINEFTKEFFPSPSAT